MPTSELTIDAASTVTQLEEFIRVKVDHLQREGAVVGLSGGIDSAVVAALAARALRPEKVLALLMPDRDSARASRRDALRLADRLGIRTKTIGLTKFLWLIGIYWKLPLWLLGPRRFQAKLIRRYHDGFVKEWGESPLAAIMVGTKALPGPLVNQAVAYHRVKGRLRAILLYYYAELENLLVLGTCNRTEKAIGFFVKYGDAAADVAPLETLYKTQVRQLAAFLEIPEQIISKPPSPDLLPGITDEYAIGLSYETLDRILWRLEAGMDTEEIAGALGLELNTVVYVRELMRRSAHMRAQPEVPPW
ncbi:MAG: NAD(+) synthase [Chloroflexi bacterium]|nr:NAD(+) synthase [Chloroflexota bacterium]